MLYIPESARAFSWVNLGEFVENLHSPFCLFGSEQIGETQWNKLKAYLKTESYFNRVLGPQSPSTNIKRRALTVVDDLCARIDQSQSYSRGSLSQSV